MFITYLLRTLSNHMAWRRTMRELAMLDDRQLADIGFSRGRIRTDLSVFSRR